MTSGVAAEEETEVSITERNKKYSFNEQNMKLGCLTVKKIEREREKESERKKLRKKQYKLLDNKVNTNKRVMSLLFEDEIS